MIVIEKLNKIYTSNNVHALKDVHFNVKKGEFMALLGPNGAGKTTLINTLAGHVIKSSGKVEIAGYSIDTNALDTKKLIGIVPQEISFDSFFTVNEVLTIQSGYFGIKDNQAYIDELLTELTLKEKKYTNSRHLSGGMKRRLLIAKALVHRPKIVILDEPTAGVDVELRQSLYKYLKKLHAQGLTIVLTTHYLEEAESLCDRIVIINEGKIIIDKGKEELIETLGGNTMLEFSFKTPINSKDYQFLTSYAPIVHNNKLHLTAYKRDLKALFKLLADRNVDYSSFRLIEDDLEDIFLKLVNGNNT